MIPPYCIGPDVDRSRISPEARISGASYLTGPRTSVGPGAVLHDARVHNAVVEAEATLVDSILATEGKPATHRCDAAGRTVVGGASPGRIGRGGHVAGSTLLNTSVDAGTRIVDTWARDCRFGKTNHISAAKATLVATGSHVTIHGPTEVSEAYFGHHASIDGRGYFEGIFSNTFLKIRFNPATGRLEVHDRLDLPHVSRYGTNTINSTNSGKLLPQPDGILHGFGPHRGLWHDPLLAHEQVELAPCCWVVPWTKVVGQSGQPHEDEEALVNDSLTTYIMPFGIAGVGGDLTRGLVMPGELSNGLGPKQRRGAWVFTYAPDAVIKMVGRLHEALEHPRKALADTIVIESLTSAVDMTKALATKHQVDLSIPADRQRKGGWARWVATTYALLQCHLQEELWRFEDGQPREWEKKQGRWTHPRIDRLLTIAPDALACQISEEALFSGEDPIPRAVVAVPSGMVEGTGAAGEIAPTARVAPDARIGPGCRIGPETVVESGAVLWNSVVQGSKVGPGAVIERSVLEHSEIGSDATVRSCYMIDSEIGRNAAADAARCTRSRLAPDATLAPFADLVEVRSQKGLILGSAVHSAEIESYLMSMHMAGRCTHLKVLPTAVRVEGRTVLVPAVPMIGGGAQILGTPEAPVTIECCFLGSNAVLEPGTYVGFGCFLLGALEAGAGLLPFTVSAGGDVRRHQIGGVLNTLASTIITHFLGWTFQAVGPEGAMAVAELVRQSARHGQDAIRGEQARRAGHETSSDLRWMCYHSLADYSEQQLQAGLTNYERALESEAWEISVQDGELRFISKKGHWQEKHGAAFWNMTLPDTGPFVG